jgi:hypothetical protein
MQAPDLNPCRRFLTFAVAVYAVDAAATALMGYSRWCMCGLTAVRCAKGFPPSPFIFMHLTSWVCNFALDRLPAQSSTVRKASTCWP